MIGLDTNVLVRYLTQDDPSQARLATELIERRLSEQDPGFISVVAMVEMAWVLERAYGLGAADIAAVIERLLQAAELVVEDEQEVFIAMIALKEGRGSFADALTGALGQRAGCTVTATFDRKALLLPGFALPERVDR
jgi:predicted nucleic-acid-binding protein